MTTETESQYIVPLTKSLSLYEIGYYCLFANSSDILLNGYLLTMIKTFKKIFTGTDIVTLNLNKKPLHVKYSGYEYALYQDYPPSCKTILQETQIFKLIFHVQKSIRLS